MTATDDTATPRPGPPSEAAGSPARATMPGVLVVAAVASLGAGAIHATAAGAHGEHRAAAVAFTLTAIAQLGWGAWAFARAGRRVGLLGAAINAVALGGWLQAKTGGIGLVAGLDTRESVQFADASAAALALVAVAGAIAALARGQASGSGANPVLIGVAAVTTVGLVIPAMVAAGSHSHAGGHAHGAVPQAVPYLATLPVNLSGVPGVSDKEVAQAEALVTESLQKLPRFADIATIVALGYRTIGDVDTGFEHFVNWKLVSDGRVLDPDYPESLVFKVDETTGTKTLSAAMFIANPGDTLDTTPEVGGALVQWHVHDNLCFDGEPYAWWVAGVTEPGEDCRPGTFRLSQSSVPMVHVWIIPQKCGPFAALEGDGAGRIKPGEDRLCDHVHGAPR